MPFSFSVSCEFFSDELFGKTIAILPDITTQNAIVLLLAHKLFYFIYTECVSFKLDYILGFFSVSVISLCISVVFLAWKILCGLGFYLYKSHGIEASTKRCCLNKSDAIDTLLSASLGIGL